MKARTLLILSLIPMIIGIAVYLLTPLLQASSTTYYGMSAEWFRLIPLGAMILGVAICHFSLTKEDRLVSQEDRSSGAMAFLFVAGITLALAGLYGGGHLVIKNLDYAAIIDADNFEIEYSIGGSDLITVVCLKKTDWPTTASLLGTDIPLPKYYETRTVNISIGEIDNINRLSASSPAKLHPLAMKIEEALYPQAIPTMD